MVALDVWLTLSDDTYIRALASYLVRYHAQLGIMITQLLATVASYIFPIQQVHDIFMYTAS